ncbi:YoaK family protein [Pontibacter litorisediminis]|uniref:YoaK family protein n=1 Tax=Pontibacter litorisediminis TaxID=1846260 RepID=UPI0023EDF269|nr:YoaK family protein [Pontibacter litorisediminis]
MFRHRGKNRTLKHNLKLASLLSSVAGIVNITGVFALHQLTTNVTGHFAFFADEVARHNFTAAWGYLWFILAFFSGAAVSGALLEAMLRRNKRFVNVPPVALEVLILVVVALLSWEFILRYPVSIACCLLFAMGLQNALVTSISNAVVRTTHLTGLFTDLGIEVAQLFFFRKQEQRQKLKGSIGLRLTIISFFFLGCIVGGFLFSFYATKTLLLAAAILIAGLVWDSVKYKVVRLKRQYSS